MQKIPTLFLRDPGNPSRVTDQIHPDCTWVLERPWPATRKYDGTCVMRDEGRWWARREVKPNKEAPPLFVAVERDEVTGKTVGWEPIEQSSFFKFVEEALDTYKSDGTYELCGPKINGNPEGFERHTLIRHADAEMVLLGHRTVPGYKSAVVQLGRKGWEGVVWHHPDGRMAKLKVRDLR